MTGPTAAFEGRARIVRAGDRSVRARRTWAAEAQASPSNTAIPSPTRRNITRRRRCGPPSSCAKNCKSGEDRRRSTCRRPGPPTARSGAKPRNGTRRNRETADHSLPYLLAVALRDGRITPAIFESARYLDPELRPLMARIRIAENPEFTKAFPDSLTSEITVATRSGRRYTERTAYPKGRARNPMSDQDIARKFLDLSSAALAPAQADAALAFLKDLEKAPDARELLDLFTIAGRASSRDFAQHLRPGPRTGDDEARVASAQDEAHAHADVFSMIFGS